jgi:hypothetical protein
MWMFLCCAILVAATAVNSEETGSSYCAEKGVGAQCEEQAKERTVPWRPQADHRCNIRKVTVDELFSRHGPTGLPPMYHEPLIIMRGANNSSKKSDERFRALTSRDGILAALPPDFNVTLSSSNSFSAHRRTIPLKQYLKDVMAMNGGETLPDQLSNETWYLFGETYSQEWKDSILQHYQLPPCQTCTDDLVALSFGIGNRGSGVQWHVHGPGFAEALWGRKHWILYPRDEKPTFHPDQTSRNWMEYTYPELESLPYECTLVPGDIIYFPNMWWHATINLDPYTSFVSTFTTEHDVFQ